MTKYFRNENIKLSINILKKYSYFNNNQENMNLSHWEIFLHGH